MMTRRRCKSRRTMRISADRQQKVSKISRLMHEKTPHLISYSSNRLHVYAVSSSQPINVDQAMEIKENGKLLAMKAKRQIISNRLKLLRREIIMEQDGILVHIVSGEIKQTSLRQTNLLN